MEWWLIVEYVGEAGKATMTYKGLSSAAECVALLSSDAFMNLPLFEFRCSNIK